MRRSWRRNSRPAMRVGARQFADGADSQRFQFRAGLGPDAVDLARGQRPDARRNVGGRQQRQPVGLVQVRRDLRKQLVRRDADRARQARRRPHRVLDGLRHGAGAPPRIGRRFARGQSVEGSLHVGQVDVDFIDPPVLDLRRQRAHGRLEQPRILAISCRSRSAAAPRPARSRRLSSGPARNEARARAPRRWRSSPRPAPCSRAAWRICGRTPPVPGSGVSTG